MTDRVCVVTGATSGIGRGVAFQLAALGATLVLAVRNSEKGEATRKEIVERTGARVDVVPLDLTSLRSTRAFAEMVGDHYPTLHVLVNNAGIFTRNRKVTEDGLESQFQVNHLGHFLLTALLEDALRAGAPSRIVNVSSEAHRGARINFNDLQGETRYSGYRAYGQSKLAQILFTHELDRQLDGSGVTVNAVHPGVIRTNLGRGEYPRAFDLVRRFLKGPETGARTPVYVATSPTLGGVTGRYFSNSREARSSPESYDDAVARRLWEVSFRLAGMGG